MSTTPLVSVVMSVYNAAPFLSEAIDSILTQTFTDFEFIIINDGSTDNSKSIIESFRLIDSRIIIISRENKGLIYSLNEGISIAKGKYIARMDADDISTKYRLGKQIDFLEVNEEIGVLSCDFKYFNEEGQSDWPFFREINDEIVALLPFHSPIVHAAALIRRELFDTVEYDNSFEYAEDYRLWADLSKITKFHNLKECLYFVRQHDFKVSVKYNDIQVSNSLIIIKDYLRGENVKTWDEAIHKQIITTFYNDNDIKLYDFLKYVNGIQKDLKSSSQVFDWLKSIFIVHNTKIPKGFIFNLIINEFSVVKKFSFVQLLSVIKRSF